MVHLATAGRKAGYFPYHPVLDDAFRYVSLTLGVNRLLLASPRRQPYLVDARALFVWVVRRHGPASLSYPIIGHWLGDRDHTSIMHLFKVVAPRLREREPEFKRLCDHFEAWRNQEDSACQQ